MGPEFPICVMRRDKSGQVVNTICQTLDRVLCKIDELREQGCSDVWIEDLDGHVIDVKTLRVETGRTT